jgi:hypothetical protein
VPPLAFHTKVGLEEATLLTTFEYIATSDKVYQLLAHDRWFSPVTSASSTTKTGRHEIAEILLKVALNTECTLFCSLQKRARTHIVLVIGLYEL